MLRFLSSTETYTRKVGREFAKTLRGNEKVCLIGPLGTGKTTFVKGFVEGFGIESQSVMSPTFTLVREYGDKKKIYHVDLYRLEKEEEIFEAGIFDLLSSEELVLIEWADRLVKHFPEDATVVRFIHATESIRIIQIEQ